MSDPAEANAAQTVDDFRIVSTIAAGNSSKVLEVEDAAGQSFAMKLLVPTALGDPEQVAVLKHEAKVGQSLDHPNFARIHRFVKSKKHCYLLMELVACPNLKSSLSSDPIGVQGRFGKLVEQVCQALGYMHSKGWLHHDIKPDNILFSRSGELKLIDFSLSVKRQGGLAKMFGGKVKTIQGTRTYIAPETILKQPPTVQTDIYSLGVTLYEVLGGVPPFRGASPNELLKRHLSAKPAPLSELNDNVTAIADQLIGRLLAKKPAMRPKDMDEVAAEFRSIQVFKKDPIELAAEAKEKEKAEGLGLDAKTRLDSRADAARTAAGIVLEPEPKPKRPARPKPAEAPARPSSRPSSIRRHGRQPTPNKPTARWPTGSRATGCRVTDRRPTVSPVTRRRGTPRRDRCRSTRSRVSSRIRSTATARDGPPPRQGTNSRPGRNPRASTRGRNNRR